MIELLYTYRNGRTFISKVSLDHPLEDLRFSPFVLSVEILSVEYR